MMAKTLAVVSNVPHVQLMSPFFVIHVCILPRLDGPHEKVYQYLIGERERIYSITNDSIVTGIARQNDHCCKGSN